MKKINFIPIFIMVFIIFPVYATDVSGIQSGIWTLDNSPYFVIGSITVPVGESLGIEPGVEIQIMGDYRFTVQGTIEAIGTEADSIRFYSDGLRWDLIRLENEQLESNFTHCVISNADTGINSIISPVTISYSRFDDNITGIRVFGIGATNPPQVNILYSKIENSQQNGILIAQNSNTLVSNCEITNSALSTQPRGAIQLSNQSSDGHNDPTIINNHIHNNVWQGLTAWDLTGLSNINPVVENNIIEYNLTGIYLIASSGEFNNNIIRHNFVAGNPDSGAGVMVSGASAMPIFTANEFTGNFTGFYIVNGAAPDLGDLSSADPGEVGMNHIYNNIGPDGHVNSVYNLSSANIMAQNNIWDSEDHDVIADTIYDGHDDPSSGFVIFDPIFQSFTASISGTLSYLGDMMLDGIRLVLYDPLVNDVAADLIIDEPGEFTIYSDYQGEFYLYAEGIPEFETEYKPFGAYGGLFQPVLFELQPNDELTGFSFDLLDQTEPLSWNITEIIIDNGSEYYVLEKSHFIYPVEQSMILYEEDLYLKVQALLIHDYQQGETDSIYIDQDAAFIKQNDLQIGDTWLFPVYEEDFDDIIYLNAEVSASEVYEYDQIFYDGYEITFSDAVTGKFDTVWRVVEDIGVLQKLNYEEFASKRDYRLHSHDIVSGSGFFPLSISNIWSYSSFIPLLAPTELRYQRLTDNDMLLKWVAPRQNPQNNWQGYRIYRNGMMEHEFDFTYLNYEIPYPAENSVYYITSYHSMGESIPSNQIEIEITKIEEDSGSSTRNFALDIFPNPLLAGSGRSGSFSLSLTLPETSEVELKVYNIKGQKIDTLYQGILDRGSHNLAWNLIEQQPRTLANGIYFFCLHVGEQIIVRKVTVIN